MAPSSNAAEIFELLSKLDSSIQLSRGRGRNQPQIDFNQILSQPPIKLDPGELGDYKFQQKSGGPSVLGRIFDVLSRPLYTVAEPLRMAADPGGESPLDYLKGAWGGFTGKKKTRGLDVIMALDERVNDLSEEQVQEKWKNANPALRFMASLGTDIGLDPLTYINPFSIASKFKKPPVAPAEFAGAKEVSFKDVLPEFRQTEVNQVQKTIEERAAGIKVPRVSEMGVNTALDLTRPLPGRSIKMPDGRVIRMDRTTDSVPRLTAANVENQIIRPLQQTNMENAGVPGPEWFRQGVERAPTQAEMGQQFANIPPMFRNPNYVPPVEVPPAGLPRTDFDIPRAVRNPDELGPPTGMAGITPLTDIDDPMKLLARTRPTAPFGVGNSPYKNLASARKSGADQAARRDARVASNEAGERIARGFQSHKMSRSGGMPIPEALRVIGSIADGAAPAQVAKAADSVVPAALPKLSARADAEKMVDRLSNSLIDDITKGGKTRKVTTKNGEKSVKYRDEFGMREQANVYNSAYSNLIKTGKFSAAAAHAEAYKVLRHVEDRLKTAGYSPLYREGKGAPAQSFSLGDLIDELGGPSAVRNEHLTQIARAFQTGKLQQIKSPDVQAAITRLMERNSQQAMPHVLAAAETTNRLLRGADDIIPPGRMTKWQEELTDNLIPSMKAADAPISATSMASKLLDDVKKASVPARERVSSAAKKQADAASARGTFGPKTAIVTESQTRNLEKSLGLQFEKLGEQVTVEPYGAWGTFMSRIATHYGMRDVRPFFNSEIQKGIWQTNAKAKYLGQVMRQYSKAQQMEAWRSIQGIAPATTREGQQLASELDAIMYQLVNPQGVNSVAKSAVVLQKDLNSALARLGESFRFTRKKDAKDALGRSHDYSKGTDWLNSWKIHETQEPAEFILKLDTALEQVTHRYTFFDEAAARWGSRKYGGEYRYKTSVDRLNGYYFPEAIAKQLERVGKSLDEIYAPNSNFGRQFDNIMGALKSGMTIYNPSHHIRNGIGDVYNSWMAGVDSVVPYYKAQQVLGSQRHRYPNEFAGVAAITDDNALRRALTRPGDIVVKTKNGFGLTAEQIYLAAGDNGLLQSAHAVDDIIGKQVTPLVLGGRVQKLARGASEWRDHEVRLAHFIDIIRKSKATQNSIDDVFKKAAQEVRRWHPDGLDLTAWEKKYMRRIFPFYSWTRKAIPLVIESAIKQPGKTMLYPRMMQALQESAGIESPDIGNPFPTDQLYPDWVRAEAIGPVASAGNGPLGFLTGMSATAPGGPNYTIANPGNPFVDLVSQFGGMGDLNSPLKGAGSMLNPFLKVPYELTSGDELRNNRPIAGREADYFTEQLPLASVFSRLTNLNILGQPTQKGEREGLGNEQAFWNWLTALGIVGTGPLQENAKIEQQLKGR